MMSALHSAQFADTYDPKTIEIYFCIPFNTPVHFWRTHTEGFIHVLAGRNENTLFHTKSTLQKPQFNWQ